MSIPSAIVQEVREWAAANGTSLNQYVRECLEAKATEIQDTRKQKAREFKSFLLGLSPSGLPCGYTFNRERDAVREVTK
ncbi:MAG: hypothetical protein IJI36_16915 [Kiritimatiellae bacterium]|nr:hypothetical protein [Kiritimatiellia bacterium]